jgi:Protein of unknown function (DUF4238)
MSSTTQSLDLRRGNHFVPACYQRGFTDAEGKVWIRFADGTLKHLVPESVGLKNDLYIFEGNGVETDKVEIFFGQHVEDDFAHLSRRIKEEADQFSQMSGDEAGVLLRFVASQAVRTLGHKATMSEQANGAPIDANTFVRVMVRKMKALLDYWTQNLPTIRFFTPLPNIGETYITGDYPVVVLLINDNQIWEPISRPVQGITNLTDILQHPKHALMVALSPYICASIVRGEPGQVHLPAKTVDLKDVREFNDLISNQCKIFTLARDRSSLE